MRKVLALLFVLGWSAALLAQGNPADWGNLSALRPGDKIQIVDASHNKHAVQFVSVSETAIAYSASAGAGSTPRQDVRGVKLLGKGHRGRNTLIGLGVGAGLGAGVTAAAWESNGFLGTKAAGAAVGGVLGGLTGAIVGALIPSGKTIYRAAAH